MSAELFTDALDKLLAVECTSQVVREVEAGGSVATLWASINESGFADVLLPEVDGGAGLSLLDIFPLVLACGRSALPVPLAFTMLARAVLQTHGVAIPRGPIAIAIVTPDTDGSIRAANVPYGLVAETVLIDAGNYALVMPAAAASRESVGPLGSLAATLQWSSSADAARIDASLELRTGAATLLAAQMAGAMVETLARSVAYANERKQFGKSIGKFQALQQQLSVMAEHVFAAHAAAEIGCTGGWQGKTYSPSPTRAAVAKARCSDAVLAVATIAHAVHGAIGVTLEYDLHLLTRRLHEWRLAFGGERYWQQRLGEQLLSTSRSKLEFIRKHVA